jgi:WD40 repeat protein
MSSSGLNVQCLASTSITERTWRGTKQEERDDGQEDAVLDETGLSDREECSMEMSDEEESGRVERDRTSGADSSDSQGASSPSDASSSSLEEHHISCIQEAQLSPDGTCIFTSDHNRVFSVYAIDTNIANEPATRSLRPYAQSKSPNPVWAFAANPLFNVQDANSTHVLISRRDSYITLHNALWDIFQTHDTSASDSTNKPVDISRPMTSYKLINHLTEAIDAPLSLAYSHDGTHFFAGEQNVIATFDLECNEEPIHKIPTIPSKNSKLKGGGRGFKGWISALSLSPPTSQSHGGMIAAGSRTRYVGIYDATSGSEVTQFSLPGTVDGKKFRNQNLQHIMGDGVSSLKWSPCGKYLYVAERSSDALLIYDVRNFSLSLGYCAGRNAVTKQKLGFDVWNAGASPYDVEAVSHEIWAGGTDGMVRVWKDPYRKQGAVEADEVFRIGNAPVVSTLVHPSGGLAVAACGKFETGGEVSGMDGIVRGHGLRPTYRTWGRLDILGLS